jgi:hypothetical protein
MKINRSEILVPSVFLLGVIVGSGLVAKRAHDTNQFLRAEQNQAMHDLVLNLTGKFNAALAEHVQAEAALRQQADACARAAIATPADAQPFAGSVQGEPFTLLYEPGDPASAPNSGATAGMPAGLALLDAWKPGLGKALARLGGQAGTQGPQPIVPGLAPPPPNVRLRWVLYRRPSDGVTRALVAPPGGEVMDSSTLEGGAQ